MQLLDRLRRSLAVKLILAFLVVGLLGISLVVLLVIGRTRLEFNRFLSQQDQTALVEALETYYATAGSWDGVAAMLATTPALAEAQRNLLLVDTDGMILSGNGDLRPEQTVADVLRLAGDPITVDGQTVGFLLPHPIRPPPAGEPPPSPGQLFLDRVTWAAATSAAIATALALLVGAVLARRLTRPMRALIAATQTLARGTFDQRVAVPSHDEIGQLAVAFNHMSADLARASQQRQQMTADLAHDLRTPLSILRGYTQGLKDEQFEGSATIYAVMHQEVEQLQRLVEDLRVLSLADADALVLHRRAVNPQLLLERVGLAFMMQAEAQGIALVVDAAERLPAVHVDTDRMSQVLTNLVSNALRFTRAGEIRLTAASSDGAEVTLAVRDTGSGIAPDDLPFVFDRFYRADKSRHRGTTTSGLGLAIAKALVEAHGGTLTVASTPGHGTAFTITLPALPPGAPARPATIPVAGSS